MEMFTGCDWFEIWTLDQIKENVPEFEFKGIGFYDDTIVLRCDKFRYYFIVHNGVKAEKLKAYFTDVAALPILG